VTKTQSAGPISCLEHCAIRVLHCTIVIRAAMLMFPLFQTVITNRMRPQKLRGPFQFALFLQHNSTAEMASVDRPLKKLLQRTASICKLLLSTFLSVRWTVCLSVHLSCDFTCLTCACNMSGTFSRTQGHSHRVYVPPSSSVNFL